MKRILLFIAAFLIVCQLAFTQMDSVKVRIPTKKMALVKLLNGEVFEGELISANDSTATYQSNLGLVTIFKTMILSIQPINGLSSSNTKKILVTEYDNTALIIPAIAGAVWAVTLFSDAKYHRNAANQLNSLGLGGAAKSENDKYGEKLFTGIVVSLASVVFFGLAITPTESYLEQPVTVIPTSNGVRVAVHF